MEDKEEPEYLFPLSVSVEAGKCYRWCACRGSKNQPFCDKEPSCRESVSFKADLSEEASLCNCKQTKNPPWCDGSHAKLLMDFINKRRLNGQ